MLLQLYYEKHVIIIKLKLTLYSNYNKHKLL